MLPQLRVPQDHSRIWLAARALTREGEGEGVLAITQEVFAPSTESTN